MTSGTVTFDPAAFVLRYPIFAAYNTAHAGGLQMFFDEAVLLLNNKISSLVRDINQRTILLNMLTAHIAQLNGVLTPAGSGSTANQVGRVASATEGSVSASLDMGAVYGSKAWYQQTQWGTTYWQMTARWRSFRYVAPRRCC